METDRSERAGTSPIEYERPSVLRRVTVEALLGKDPGGPSGIN